MIQVTDKSNGETVYGIPLADLLAALKLPSNLNPVRVGLGNIDGSVQGLILVVQSAVTESKSTIDPATGTKTPVPTDPAPSK